MARFNDVFGAESLAVLGLGGGDGALRPPSLREDVANGLVNLTQLLLAFDGAAHDFAQLSTALSEKAAHRSSSRCALLG